MVKFIDNQTGKIRTNVRNLLTTLKKETNQRNRFVLDLDDKTTSYEASDFELFDVITGVTNKITAKFPEKLGKLIKGLKRQLKKNPDKWFIIQAGKKAYTVNTKSIDKLLKQILNNNIFIDIQGRSDQEYLVQLFDAEKIIIQVIFPRKKKALNGGFFPFINKSPFNLERYDIYRDINADNYDENCLYKAFSNSNLFTKEELNRLALIMNNSDIPINKFKEISKLMDCKIVLNRCRNDNDKTRKTTYNKENKREICIGLIDCGKHSGHFILDELIPVKLCQLKRHIKGEKVNDFSANDGKHKRNDITSFKLITQLLKKTKDFEPILSNNKIQKTQYGEKFIKINNLEYTNENITPYKNQKSFKNNKYNQRIFFDFEAYTDGIEHEPYLVCLSNGKSYEGDRCAIEMLEDIENNTLLIAHNLGYDVQFLIKYLYNIRMIKNSGKIMQVKGLYKGKSITFKDSYTLISVALSKFPGMFGLKNTEKEVMPYNLYSKTRNMRKINISDVREHLKSDEDYNQMMKNIEKWNCLDDSKRKYNDFIKFYKKYCKNDVEILKKWNCLKESNSEYKYYDFVKYSKKYCEIDVEILEKGYLKFREWIKELCGLDIDFIVSSASIADKYLQKEGCYDNCYKLSGIPRQFIQKCVVGGRVMCANNEKSHQKGKITDFDACSLYPSAIKRLDGYLKGLPKILSQAECDNFDVDKYDGYFVEALVTDLKIKRSFPLQSYLEDNRRNFSNEMVGKTIFIDKISLQDFIKYQGATVKIIKGYYYDEGRNVESSKLIQKLYEERKKKKKEKNEIQSVYKLIMNSSYGRTIMKPITTELKFIHGDDIKRNNYIVKNHNFIKEITEIGHQKTMFKVIKPLNTHFSAPHIGVEILSMSKRIMNEVMCLAEDRGLPIYYQDTDSMHIRLDDVNILADLYEKRYSRQLIGKDMGQFHSDFDFKSEEEPYAIESYFLMKKCYIDKVRILQNGKEKFDFHIRMKGVPNWSIKQKASEMKIDEIELYKKIYNGEKITFEMKDKHHVRFKKECNFTYSTIINDNGRSISL